MDPSYNAICKPLHLNSDVAARAAEWGDRLSLLGVSRGT